MFGALWDTAFQMAVSPFRWAVEKGKEGAGRIRNQMEARAAYVPGQPQEEGPSNVEVLSTGKGVAQERGSIFQEWVRAPKNGCAPS